MAWWMSFPFIAVVVISDPDEDIKGLDALTDTDGPQPDLAALANVNRQLWCTLYDQGETL